MCRQQWQAASLVRTTGRPVFSSGQQEHTDYRVFANITSAALFLKTKLIAL